MESIQSMNRQQRENLESIQKQQMKTQVLLFFDVYNAALKLGNELPRELWEPINEVVRYRQRENLADEDEFLIEED